MMQQRYEINADVAKHFSQINADKPINKGK